MNNDDKRPPDPARQSSARLTRREWLSSTILASGTLLFGLDGISFPAPARVAQSDPFAGGQLLGTVEFFGEGEPPMDQPVGEELDGRLYTDLSHLTPNSLVIPTDKFYIRTRASRLLNLQTPWSIRAGADAAKLPLEWFVREAQPQGLHLMECAGNSLSAHFGMLGVADWAGVPIAKVLERVPGSDRAPRIIVSGFDTYATRSTTSMPGASWIFTRDALLDAGAFLATRMNDRPLTRDHGYPVRLFVPNWYGCTCIKWVDQIAPVDDAAPATSQMKEYAGRTQQEGIPELAREYQPAILDPAAMPVRIEKWLLKDSIEYRVVGIVWGGKQTVRDLRIRISPGEGSVPVEMTHPAAPSTWGLWSYAWQPQRPGHYTIEMRVADPGVRTRRLDAGFYARSVDIRDV